jgi:hypothetical protein
MSEKDPIDLVAESVKLQETALQLQIENQPTLRDLFAMAALQGLLASAKYQLDYDTCAIIAYRHADYMLKKHNEHQNIAGSDPA